MIRGREKTIIILLLSLCIVCITGCGDGRKDVPKSKDIEKNYVIKGTDGKPVESLLKGDSETDNLKGKESETKASKQTDNTQIERSAKKSTETECSQTNNEQEIISLTGWGGAYKNEETGRRLVIAAEGYDWMYCLYDSDGTVYQRESACSWEDSLPESRGYLEGIYFSIVQNMDGTVSLISSGAGGEWGGFRRISGTKNPDQWIEGIYGNGNVSITVSGQMAECGDENLPGGADIADVHIEYNNGMEIDARLYIKEDGSMAVIDNVTKDLRGIITFTKGKAKVAGSDFDGNYEILE